MNKHLQNKIEGHLKKLAKDKPLEEYCTDCGACCRPSVLIAAKGVPKLRVLLKDLYCKFASIEDGKSKCSVYKDRFSKAPWCANLKEMIEQGIAPGDCPYITEVEGYQPSVDLEDTEYKELLPFLKAALKSGDTSPIEKKDLDKFLDS